MQKIGDIIQDEIASTITLLDEIELRQGSYAYHQNLLHFLRKLCQVASEVTETSVKSLQDTAIRPAMVSYFQRLLPICCTVVRQVNTYCEAFDYSEPVTISSVINQLLSDRLKAITKHRGFILRGMPSFNYMYSPIGENLNDLAEQLGGGVEPLDSAFAILSFPQAIKKNVLADVNLIHEIGHLIVDAEDLVEKFLTSLAPDKNAKVTEIIEENAHLGLKSSVLTFTQKKKNNQSILANWIHELMADAIAVQLVGAAFLMSFLHHEEPLHDYESDDDKHPCGATRMRLMLKVLTSIEWNKVFEAESPAVWERAVQVSELSRIPRGESEGPADCISIILDDIIKYMLSFMQGKAYTPSNFESDKSTMYDLLKRGVPPAETFLETTTDQVRTFDHMSIINAGSFFRELNFPTWESRFPDMTYNDKIMLLNRLLTKALEISFVAQVPRK